MARPFVAHSIRRMSNQAHASNRKEYAMNIQSMTQEQKDQLLARLMAKEQAEARRKQYQEQGLSWSKNGFIVVRQGKSGDKNLPALYLAPVFLGKLRQQLDVIESFAQDSDAKNLME